MRSNLLGFFFNWFFRNKLSLGIVVFQSLVILFLMVLGFTNIQNIAQHFPSIFLICMFFMGQFFLNQTHSKFAEQKTLQALLLTGAQPSQLYLSLLVVSSLWLFLIEILLWIIMHVFFQAGHVTLSLSLFAVIMLGSLAYMALGVLCYGFTVFAQVGMSYVMMLFFPLCIPLFLFFHHALESFYNPFIPLNLMPLIGLNLLFVFSATLLYDFVAEDLT